MSSMKPDLSYFVKIPVNILNLEMARITLRDRKLTKQANDANFYFLFFQTKYWIWLTTKINIYDEKSSFLYIKEQKNKNNETLSDHAPPCAPS